MKKRFAITAALLCAGTVQAQNAEQLVQRDCSSCHGTEVYTRADRRVEFMQDLELQVERCNKNVQAGWSGDQEELVSEFLNKNYYHFE